MQTGKEKRMVQVASPARLNLKLSLGYMDSNHEDINGLTVEQFAVDKTVRAGYWARTQNQMISIQGTALEGT